VRITILAHDIFATETCMRIRIRERFSLAKSHASVGLLGAAVLCSAASHAQPDAASASEVDGARVYAADCAACHGSDGRGRSASQLGFEIPLPDFTDCDFATREPDADWSAIIHEGGPVRGFERMMPAFGDALGDAEIDAAIAHLRRFCREPDWPRGELNLPRAIFTEKAYPEDEAVITTSAVTAGNDSWSHQFLWEQRFGTRNQMELSVPLARADLGDPLGWESGFGDLAVGVKHVVLHNSVRGNIFSIGGELSLPTGDETRGFGKGTTVFESYAAFGKMLSDTSFLQLQAIAEFPSGSGFDNEVGLRAAVGKTLTPAGPYDRAWTPMFEVIGARELADGEDTAWDVVPQVQVTLNKRQHLMAAVGLRVPVTNKAERENELVFYLLWDWFDGGVLEGW
jgi:mono/diheme cytochrome c family protein